MPAPMQWRSCSDSFAALLLAAGAGAMAEPAAQSQLASPKRSEGGRFDVLIRNARVMDGTGNPWLLALSI